MNILLTICWGNESRESIFTCTSVKVSIRDLNTISYIHIIVFLISDLNDLAKVPPGAMGYGSGMRGGVDNRGEGDEQWG